MPTLKGSAPRPRTTTSFAILGLLSLRSWTTYELTKQVARSLHWFWPRAERKLYDEPKVLVADGLATATKSFTGQRPRTVYDITDTGREALRSWLDEGSAPRSSEFEAMLKVFFADAGSIDQLLTTLDAMLADSRAQLGALIGMIEDISSEAQFPERLHISALTLRLQFEQEAAVLAWTQWARSEVRKWTDTTDPGRWDPHAALNDLLAQIQVVLDRESATR